MPSMSDDLCQILVSASRDWRGGAPGDAMLKTTSRFLAGVAEDTSWLTRATELLGSCEPGEAAWIAVACATAVERGAPVLLTGSPVLELFLEWLPRLPQVSEEAEERPTQTSEQTALLEVFPFLCQAVVSHLARLPARRQAMGREVQLLERLSGLQALSHGAIWVREALLKTSGTIILLHPPSGQGCRVGYSNVANCFHLFSLLQTAVGTRLPGGRTPDASIVQVARGRGSEQVHDEAWWHYGSAQSKKAELEASIWGEGLVREIPMIEGVQVILAWPPLLGSRVWDAGFFGPHLEALPADAVVEQELSAAESEAWLKRLGIERRKKWWRWSSRG